MDNNRNYRSVNLSTVIMFVVIVAAALWMAGRMQMHRQEVSYTDFVAMVEDKSVTDVYIDLNSAVPTGTVSFMLKDGEGTHVVNVSDVEEVKDLLEENDVRYDISAIPEDSLLTTILIPLLITLGGVFLIFWLMNRQNGGANAKAMSFGKSRARMTGQDEIKVTFADVAGLKEEKEELEEIVDFLKSPRNMFSWARVSPKACSWRDLREPGRRCSRRRWQERQAFRSSVFPARILWKCSWAWARLVCVIFSRTRREIHRVLSLSTRSMLSRDGAEAVSGADMMRGSRH